MKLNDKIQYNTWYLKNKDKKIFLYYKDKKNLKYKDKTNR